MKQCVNLVKIWAHRAGKDERLSINLAKLNSPSLPNASITPDALAVLWFVKLSFTSVKRVRF